ncbi:MAG: universal stress protein [Pseudomonadota bacterium]
MYNKIIVALGLEHGHGHKAMDAARQLLSEGGQIIALHVIEPVPGMARFYLPEGQEAELEKSVMERVRERIGEKRDAEAMVLFGHPGRLIPEYAVEVGADCIIVGSHQPGLGDYLLGSTAARVVRHASCAVLVVR